MNFCFNHYFMISATVLNKSQQFYGLQCLLCKESFIGRLSYLFIYKLPMATFMLQWQNWVVITETTTQPSKSKVFTIWTITKISVNPLPSSKQCFTNFETNTSLKFSMYISPTKTNFIICLKAIFFLRWMSGKAFIKQSDLARLILA